MQVTDAKMQSDALFLLHNLQSLKINPSFSALACCTLVVAHYLIAMHPVAFDCSGRLSAC
jgi:hypothetical protein